MFGWLRRRTTRPIPDALWEGVLRDFPFLRQASAGDDRQLRELASNFLAHKEFQGAGGLEITDAIALAITAQAVLPVLHLGLRWYDDFVGIVVHPDQVARRTTQDESGVVHEWDEVLAGEAMEQGPVMLSWTDVQAAGGEDGYNVVIHEFLHKIDMRDGEPDGCPPIGRERRGAWMKVLDAQYQAFREKVVIAERFGGEPTWLDPYAAENHGEFFAVAGEAYFVNRERFSREFPALLELFDGFFKPSN
jgi:Mlc titration factor MtfA (ptsG expression regulator)